MLVYQRGVWGRFFVADCSYPEMLMMQESIGISIPKMNMVDIFENTS
jgi:hypothetical protein